MLLFLQREAPLTPPHTHFTRRWKFGIGDLRNRGISFITHYSKKALLLKKCCCGNNMKFQIFYSSGLLFILGKRVGISYDADICLMMTPCMFCVLFILDAYLKIRRPLKLNSLKIVKIVPVPLRIKCNLQLRLWGLLGNHNSLASLQVLVSISKGQGSARAFWHLRENVWSQPPEGPATHHCLTTVSIQRPVLCTGASWLQYRFCIGRIASL